MLVALLACGGQAKEVEHARYDAELSVLLVETAEVVRRWYPTIEVDPRGTIRTPWQRVPAPRQTDEFYETRTTSDRHASRTKFFVRFHITISPSRPSSVEVVGHTARLVDGTSVPTEYRREEEPLWTRELADNLRLKIHSKLERYAR